VGALSKEKMEKAYPACRSILGSDVWDRIIAACTTAAEPETFPNTLALQMDDLGLQGFLPELARLEWSCHEVTSGKIDIPTEVDRPEVNPTLELLQLSWKNLPSIFNSQKHVALATPEPGDELVLVWRDPRTGDARVRAATDEDLLVLKMVVEGIKPEEAAAVGRVPVRAVDAAIDRALHRAILLAPRSRIRRNPASFSAGHDTLDRFLASPTFAIQWHITQACDLHCKHCYDRSKRSPLRLDQALRILDDLRTFCRSRNVRGHVSFTGGNPLLYPHFFELYRGASERGLAMAILGNPAPREQIEEIVAIERPVFFQVSLEGLPEHNDMIRGPGHFKRVIEFLGVLRELEVSSMVMLTLTKDNIDQVLPLAEMLRHVTDDFTFNRLSMVGEGANLALPARDEYVAFLEAYAEASKSNPIMGLKDNLFNILRHQMGIEPFGGCTGYGCGAAFNFIAILSDGEAHACRKFPSPIGNVFEQKIVDLYESEMAEQYRSGCHACRSCAIRPVCGGCLAIAHSHGLNVFEERDPYCFL
jgi:selenobiotic family peptide radical SAM maturase